MYDFLRDQGSLIAGLLALIAGILAYLAGERQARAVERQNTQLSRAERRQLARTNLVAAQMLDGVLAGLDEGLEREIRFSGNGPGQHLLAADASASRRRVQKPSLEVVWNQLALLDPEWIKSYISLDHEIMRFVSIQDTKDPERNYMLGEYRRLQQVVRSLRGLLETYAQNANDILIEFR